MRKNSRVLIAGTLLMVIVLVFYTNNEFRNKPRPLKKYDELMLYDFTNSYPSSPFDVIEVNNKIIKYLYSEDIVEEEIEPLISLQRNLFAESLNNLNPIDIQIQTMKEQLKTNKENKVRVSDINTNPPEYSNKNNSISIVKSLYYMTKGGNTYRTYILIKEKQEHWKIYSWSDSKEKFITIEELETGKLENLETDSGKELQTDESK